MEGLFVPWSLGSSAGEAGLRESGLGLSASLQGSHCRNLSVEIFFVGVGSSGTGTPDRWGAREQRERSRQRKEFPNKHLPASENDPGPN